MHVWKISTGQTAATQHIPMQESLKETIIKHRPIQHTVHAILPQMIPRQLSLIYQAPLYVFLPQPHCTSQSTLQLDRPQLGHLL